MSCKNNQHIYNGDLIRYWLVKPDSFHRVMACENCGKEKIQMISYAELNDDPESEWQEVLKENV